MKAIFIPNKFNVNTDLEILNKELKDCNNIELDIELSSQGYEYGRLLIVSNITRKDKLKKLSKISNEKGTTDNSL